MKNYKWLALGLAVALGAGGIIAFNANAQNKPQWRPGMGAKIAQRVKEKLNLSDEQVAKIKQVLKAERENLSDHLARLHEANKDLRAAIRQPDLNEGVIRNASAKVAAAQADLAVLRAKLFHQINPILTESQRKQVNEFRDKVDDFFEKAIDRIGEQLGE